MLKLALVVLVFEISLAPFLAEEVGAAKNCIVYETQYNSLDLPDFLKEQDEKESEKSSSFCNSVPILDLATHNDRLKTAHQSIIEPLFYPSHTAKFTLFHSLLI